MSAGAGIGPDLRQPGDAGQQRLDDVRPARLLHAEVEQGVQQARRLRVQRIPAEVRQVVGGRRPVELVLLADRDDDLVDQRVAEPRDLPPAASQVLAPVMATHVHAAALGGGPHADDGVARLRVLDGPPVARDVGLRHLQDERVGVIARNVVLAAALVAEADVRTAGLVDVDPVEDRVQVEEERIVGGPHERLAAALDRGDGAIRHGRVVGDRLRPDVVGRDRHVRRDPLRAPVMALPVRLPVEVVRLDEVDVRIVDRRDRGRRVEERLRVAEALPELPPVRDVLAPVAGVVDLDVVPRLWIELAEVRASGRLLERDPVGDDRQAAGSVLRREGVDVRVVGRGVREDLWCLTVTRADHAADRERPGDERGHRRRAKGFGSAHPRTPWGWGWGTNRTPLRRRRRAGSPVHSQLRAGCA